MYIALVPWLLFGAGVITLLAMPPLTRHRRRSADVTAGSTTRDDKEMP
jgi:hypothetical protein